MKLNKKVMTTNQINEDKLNKELDKIDKGISHLEEGWDGFKLDIDYVYQGLIYLRKRTNEAKEEVKTNDSLSSLPHMPRIESFEKRMQELQGRLVHDISC